MTENATDYVGKTNEAAPPWGSTQTPGTKRHLIRSYGIFWYLNEPNRDSSRRWWTWLQDTGNEAKN